MSRLISVVTALHRPSVPYLPDAFGSLAGQELPAGWDWEWLVQEDGDTGAAVDFGDARVRPGHSRKSGAGTTRNMALARARGELVRVLDADDTLTPGALARDIAAFEAAPAIGWTTSAALDRLPDGGTVAHGGPAPGALAGRTVLRSFADGYRLIVHPATLCVRRDLAVALGGWMALPAGEDTGLLIAVAAVADGWFTGEPGLLYRKHDRQITGDPAWTEPAEWNTRMALIAERAAALSHRWPRLDR